MFEAGDRIAGVQDRWEKGRNMAAEMSIAEFTYKGGQCEIAIEVDHEIHVILYQSKGFKTLKC